MSVKMYVDRPSDGAIALAKALDIKRLRVENSRWRARENDVVINWGSSNCPVFPCLVLNHPDAVHLCTNKLEFFKQLEHSDVRCVPFTTQQEVAVDWLTEGHSVVARTKLNASGGDGIVLIDDPLQAFVKAPLYTRYVKKKDEYRVHYTKKNGTFLIQRKAMKKEFEGEVNHRIRNLAGGYIYSRNDIVPPDDVLVQADRLRAALSLDFGAIDLIYNEKKKEAYVLEVNTAPGLEGSTVDDYCQALKNYA